MFPVLQIWDAWPYVLSVYVIWCNIEALKKIVLQNDHEVPKKVKKSLSNRFNHTHFSQ